MSGDNTGLSNPDRPLLFLIGNRGSGKSTVGASLAQLLDVLFIDLDKFLVARNGRTIADIVATDGWPAFRRLESQALRAAVSEAAQPAVIATGGGIVLSQENCDFMRRHGHVVWLDVPLACAHARLTATPDNANRPSLTGADMLAELRAVFAEREPLYQAACTHVVNGDQDCSQICADIMGIINAHAKD